MSWLVVQLDDISYIGISLLLSYVLLQPRKVFFFLNTCIIPSNNINSYKADKFL